MTALDTNVLLRIITRDNPAQAARAVVLVEREEKVFLPKTVLLELEWVLRSTYRYSRGQVLSALRGVLSIGNAEIEDEGAVAQAIEWYEHGMDFADGLHLASAGRQHRFATFDAALERSARRLKIADIVLL